MISKIKQYNHDLIHDEEGMELLQLAIVVGITVLCMAALFTLKDQVIAVIEKATEQVENDVLGPMNGAGGNP